MAAGGKMASGDETAAMVPVAPAGPGTER